MRRLDIYYLICVLLIPALISGCTRASRSGKGASEVQIALSLDPNPPLLGRPCRMIVSLLAEGAPVEDARLEIKGDMSHAGMAPVIVSITDGRDGVYTTAFDWTMAGDWIVTVEAALGDGTVARRQFEVTVGMPGG
jgi:hypothetical protein